MKALMLFMIALLVGCNSEEPKLSSLQGASSNKTAPIILYVLPLTVNGNYTTGSTIDFEVKFSEVVTVIGIPSISVMTGVGPKQATYRSGSGTDTLIFKLNVTAAIVDNDGISLLGPINLNGGSIYDIVEDEDAILTFISPNTSGITLNYVVIVPDGVNPQIVSIELTTPTKHSYKGASDPNPVLRVTFSENVTVNIGGTLPFIPLTIGSTTFNASFNGFDGASLNKLKFLLVTDASTPIDLDGVAFGTDINLGTSTIKDPSGMPINTLLTPIAKPKFFIIPETLRDWFDASDTLTTGTANVAASKSSVMNLAHYGTININGVAPAPKTFAFSAGNSLVGDSAPQMYKVLIVYRNSVDPDGKVLLKPANAQDGSGCYVDYSSQLVCTAFGGGAVSNKIGGNMNAMWVNPFPVPVIQDYGISFSGGKIRLGPDCIGSGYGCAWFNPSDYPGGERLDTDMDIDGVMTYVDYDYTGAFKYSIVTFSGTPFQPMFGDLGFSGEIAEIMFFDDGFSTAATSTDLAAIEAYLSAKYTVIDPQ